MILSASDCFIGIAASVIRLMMGLTFNIVFMNRIDFCLFRDPLEQFGKISIQKLSNALTVNLIKNLTNLDRANLSYWHFVYEEFFSTQGQQSGRFDF